MAVADANLTVSIYRLIDVPLVLNNVKLTMNGDLTLALPVETYGFVEIDGQEYTLDLSLSPTVSVFPGSTLVLKNMMVTGISGSKINNVDNTGQVQLQNTTWVQSGDYQFVRGSLQINNKVLMTGASNFVYQTSQISTITSNAQLMFDSGMTFSYAPSSASNNLLNFQDSTAELYLYQTTLRTSTIGLQLTKGMVTVDGICNVVSNAVTQAQGVRFGDGVLSANNINLMILPESGLNLVSGFLVYNNV
ncbi:MAG: hypothetical protein NTX86_00145 [Candidatus Dependentiae bacterium]|nr:hypothetical protein [Candidatus Dependentiae bacterium]